MTTETDTRRAATYKAPRVLYWFAGDVIGEPWRDQLGNTWVLFETRANGHRWTVAADHVTYN